MFIICTYEHRFIKTALPVMQIFHFCTWWNKQVRVCSYVHLFLQLHVCTCLCIYVGMLMSRVVSGDFLNCSFYVKTKSPFFFFFWCPGIIHTLPGLPVILVTVGNLNIVSQDLMTSTLRTDSSLIFCIDNTFYTQMSI